MMDIELNRAEVETLLDALKSWMQEPAHASLSASIIKRVAEPLRSSEQIRADIEKDGASLKAEIVRREESVLALRLKLVQHRNRLSEHQDAAAKNLGGG